MQTLVSSYSYKHLSSVHEVQREAWNALSQHDNPFITHEFLGLLEDSKSVGPRTGWLPQHVAVFAGDQLVGATPTYLKTDSYGEYIFDWSWAEAAQRAGLDYYPKIVVAVPFTPATGPRLLVHPLADAVAVRAVLLQGIEALRAAAAASSTHFLFPMDEEAQYLQAKGYIRRATHQFHFRNPGYTTYDGFLATLRSESRKQLRKERRIVAEAGIVISQRLGSELTEQDWSDIRRFYLHTASRKWGRPYLTSAFFDGAVAALANSALVFFAEQSGERIGMSLSFIQGTHMYGRYYGATADVSGLHFELCYHRLIDFAAQHGIQLVEAGAQGEHKVKRGFQPVQTHSAHRFADPRLDAAVRAFAAREMEALTAELEEWDKHTPYRADARPNLPLRAGL